jgi:uncharacterized protein YggT (Ycf19 family)
VYGAGVALLYYALNAAMLLVAADALFSWMFKPTQFPRSLTKPLLDPVLDPLRGALHPFTGNLDLSPLIALAVLFTLQKLIERRPAEG